MPIEDPVFSGDQVRHDDQKIEDFLKCDTPWQAEARETPHLLDSCMTVIRMASLSNQRCAGMTNVDHSI